jgi:hypothetical protein
MTASQVLAFQFDPIWGRALPPLTENGKDTPHFREDRSGGDRNCRGFIHSHSDDFRALRCDRWHARGTTEDDEAIRNFVAKGATVIRASAALKRSADVVRERARKLGCPFPPLKSIRKKRSEPGKISWRAY